MTPFIHPMTRDELGLALEWAAAEGWNPGLDDARCFHAADVGGFLLATVGGEPVACISAVAYDAAFGFLGFYIVHPAWRGRGLGLAIWRAAMERLGSRVIGLDGVVAQQENYRRSGFVLAHRNQRFQGVGGGEIPAGVVAIGDVPLDRVIAYDAPLFGRARASFLGGWLNHTGWAVVADGELRGYGVIRPCRRGHKVGPLFADTPEVADRLFRALVATVPGEVFFLDLPQSHGEAIALAGRYGLSPVFETARMYRGGDPGLPLHRTYGITSFELG